MTHIGWVLRVYVFTPTIKGIGGNVRSNQVREKKEQGSRFSRPEIEWCDKAHVHTMLYRYRENSHLNREETLISYTIGVAYN